MNACPPSPGSTRRIWLGFILLFPLFWLCACRLSIEPREIETHGDHDKEDIASSSRQIRLQMRALVDPLSGEIESTADRIMADTADPDVRRAALEWKAQAVPAIRESLFQPDPGMALFDTWVLTHQMAIYFSEGQGRRRLGDLSPVALATCLSLEDTMMKVAASFTESGDVSDIRGRARDWAAAHPIVDSVSHRESTLSRHAQQDLGAGLSASEAIGDIPTVVDDLSRRVEIYSDQLFRQARWEAELGVDEITRNLKLDQAMPLAGEAVESFGNLTETVESLIPAVERLTVVAEGMPELVTAERITILKSAGDELRKTVELAQNERAIIMKHITSERLAAIQSLHEAIATEREVLTEDIKVLSIEAIDHAFLRITQLAAALVGILILFFIALLLIIRFYAPRMVRQFTLASSTTS